MEAGRLQVGGTVQSQVESHWQIGGEMPAVEGRLEAELPQPQRGGANRQAHATIASAGDLGTCGALFALLGSQPEDGGSSDGASSPTSSDIVNDFIDCKCLQHYNMFTHLVTYLGSAELAEADGCI